MKNNMKSKLYSCVFLLLLPSFGHFAEDAVEAPHGLSEKMIDLQDTTLNQEFKFVLPAGGTECFYQNMEPGATFYMRFTVLKGQKRDRKVDMLVWKPHVICIGMSQVLKGRKRDRKVDMLVWKPGEKEFLVQHLAKDKGQSEFSIVEKGDYKMCFDNSFDRYNPKLIEVYLSAFNMKKWEALANDTMQMFASINDTRDSIEKILTQVKHMKGHMVDVVMVNLEQLNHARDARWQVDALSLTLLVVIIVAALGQVYFVRYLFYEPKRRVQKPSYNSYLK